MFTNKGIVDVHNETPKECVDIQNAEADNVEDKHFIETKNTETELAREGGYSGIQTRKSDEPNDREYDTMQNEEVEVTKEKENVDIQTMEVALEKGVEYPDSGSAESEVMREREYAVMQNEQEELLRDSELTSVINMNSGKLTALYREYCCCYF